jgi:hypothetical protein
MVCREMDLLNLLSYGDRKEIGNSVEVAEHLETVSEIGSFLSLLKNNNHNDAVISHGFYALKELCQKSDQFTSEIVSFFIDNSNEFTQWEAKENFLRITLACIDELKFQGRLKKLVDSFLDDPSAIVVTYALEVKLRLLSKKKDKTDLINSIEWGVNHKKASVKARSRKLKKELIGPLQVK